MMSKDLRLRDKWQDYSGANAAAAEAAFLDSFALVFEGTDYRWAK